MSLIQLVSAFRLYGADVLFLALGVTVLTSLLKKTVMKKFSKKAFVFLPFALGLVLYAVYRMIATLSAAPLSSDFVHTIEGGFGCGCAATLYYVVYEQFLRGKCGTVAPLEPLLACVPEKTRKEAAEALYEGAKKVAKGERAAYFYEALGAYADPPMSEAELLATAELLADFMNTLEGK